jgi:uncharacterized protein YbbK (DUF523 family)
MKPAARPIRVGISACLLGEEVRYDGGHKHEPWITATLGRFVRFVPVCPEVELGLGVPRPAIRLVDDGAGGVRLVEPVAGTNLTERMARYADRRVQALESEDLSGYILKANSPSCGIDGVRVGNLRRGRGLFAEALLRRFPSLPVEDEERLRDPRVREEFLARVLDHRRRRRRGRARRPAAE